MKPRSIRGAGALPLATFACLTLAAEAADYPVSPVPFTDVSFTSGLLHDRQRTNNEVTLPFALGQLESSKRLANFDLAAEVMKRRAAGNTRFQHEPPTEYPFDDSDVFKVLEGAAFCLSVRPDPALAQRLETIIARIAAAQEPDGYLYTWRTMHPDSPAHPWIDRKRWLKDPELSHELYNLGHLYEAGVAHEQATQSRSLLDVCLKSAELVQRDFGDGEPVIAPGHQVIEMGLAKLYRKSGDPRWLDLARFFVEARGRSDGADYSQDHLPVIRQDKAVGHAVRANYLYSGMADLAALKGETRYLDALHRIWRDVVHTKLHLTGGCGARAAGEAYGESYELPHRCYNETCAAIAFLFWNHRMFLLTGEGQYMDIFERTLYNGVLSGVSLSGNRFFYPNPLEYDGREANNHGHAGRAPWFGCACCPPNILRTLASLGGYACAVRDEELFVNLYASGIAKASLKGRIVKLTQKTDYPWQGRIAITVEPDAEQTFTLSLRVPGWALGKPLPGDLYRYDNNQPAAWSVHVNGQPVPASINSGYAKIPRTWKPGDVVTLDLPMEPRRVLGHEKITATRGQWALERGPVVYCLEGIDHGGTVFDFILPAGARIKAVHRPDLLDGVTTLDIQGAARVKRTESGTLETTPATLTAIPYAFWNNRGLSPMTVWLGRDASQARPVPAPSLSSKASVKVSFARDGMDVGRLNDQQMPRNATDGFAPNFDFWPQKGGREWISYQFENPATVASSTVSWFDDTGVGECRLPKSWRLFYQNAAGAWKPVEALSSYAIRKGEPVKVTFKPVTTRAMKLELELQHDFSAGLYEWEVSKADGNHK